VIGNRPPFAITTYPFRFRALASHAGRAALGGDREVALACYAVARLGMGLLPPFALGAADAATRASSTRNWLASVAVPANARNALAAAIDAIAGGSRISAAPAVEEVASVCGAQLDAMSLAEIADLVSELRNG
jgi:hypothetical protein